ncbi:MAG: bacillithiol biosynthesis cysteine-adding enzyme BshC [Flavobacterium sp.]|nr:MAG: bacillithiol biosynthesis cysteine-adding enzyme BshC [Flavobacterium sp.]
MPNDCISYQDSGYFTPIITDYLNQKPTLQPLYNRFPSIENFKEQIQEKRLNFKGDRNALVSVLEKQYAKIDVSDLTRRNINALRSDETFTVTTGHQLNLFTGPLYFLYKIVSAINLSKELKSAYPQHDFVPVYWMATEDHDFEEINYFNFKGKKFRWHRESGGPVGRLSTEGLAEVLKVFTADLGLGHNANELNRLFSESYLKHDNLTDATRWLANELFKNEGLVILDADDRELKAQFAPYIKLELLQNVSYKAVSETIQQMKPYPIQVNPREINLFYMEDGLRERIIFEGGKFVVNNTSIRFSEDEILGLLEKNPEKFSPNVIMRPLYEEVILPNLCYIGGGGELAYWLELKSFFNKADVTFPILLLRNSVLLATQKQAAKADKLDLEWRELFLKSDELANVRIKKLSEFELDFSEQKNFLRMQFEKLHSIAEATDKSFTGAVKAQEAKQIKGLENLEKRLLKAEKRTHADALKRIADLQYELFPNGSLQERFTNFSEFWLEHGETLIQTLLNRLQPLENEFTVVVL